MRFGWEGKFSVDDIEIQLRDYPRYENPYVHAAFDSTEIKVSSMEHEFCLKL
jgi:hypothetical protein